MAATCTITSRAFFWNRRRSLIGSNAVAAAAAAASRAAKSVSGSVRYTTNFPGVVVSLRGATTAILAESEGEAFAAGESWLLCGRTRATRVCGSHSGSSSSRRRIASSGDVRQRATGAASVRRRCPTALTGVTGLASGASVGARNCATGVAQAGRVPQCTKAGCPSKRVTALKRKAKQTTFSSLPVYDRLTSIAVVSVTTSSSICTGASLYPSFSAPSSLFSSSAHLTLSSLPAGYLKKRHVVVPAGKAGSFLRRWESWEKEVVSPVVNRPVRVMARSAGNSYPYHQADNVDRVSTSFSPAKIGQEKCVEHVVLFKVKASASEDEIANMVYALRDLGEVNPPLDGVIDVSCGELMRPLLSLSPPSLSSASYASNDGSEGSSGVVVEASGGGFTHGLCVRCRDKEALKSYDVSPQHVAVVTQYVKPIMEDVMALDWEADLSTGAVDPGVQVLRFGAIRLRDGVSTEQIEKMVESCRSCEGLIPRIRQLTIGENFAPERAKGYQWGFLSRFGNLQDWLVYVRDVEQCAVMNQVVRPLASSVLVADFMTKSDIFFSSRL